MALLSFWNVILNAKAETIVKVTSNLHFLYSIVECNLTRKVALEVKYLIAGLFLWLIAVDTLTTRKSRKKIATWSWPPRILLPRSVLILRAACGELPSSSRSTLTFEVDCRSDLCSFLEVACKHLYRFHYKQWQILGLTCITNNGLSYKEAHFHAIWQISLQRGG